MLHGHPDIAGKKELYPMADVCGPNPLVYNDKFEVKHAKASIRIIPV